MRLILLLIFPVIFSCQSLTKSSDLKENWEHRNFLVSNAAAIEEAIRTSDQLQCNVGTYPKNHALYQYIVATSPQKPDFTVISPELFFNVNGAQVGVQLGQNVHGKNYIFAFVNENQDWNTIHFWQAGAGICPNGTPPIVPQPPPQVNCSGDQAWNATFFNNWDFSGISTVAPNKICGSQLHWKVSGSPNNEVSDDFSAYFEADRNFENGEYSLSLQADDGATLYLFRDGEVPNSSNEVLISSENSKRSVTRSLSGNYHIKINFVDMGGDAEIHFAWERLCGDPTANIWLSNIPRDRWANIYYKDPGDKQWKSALGVKQNGSPQGVGPSIGENKLAGMPLKCDWGSGGKTPYKVIIDGKEKCFDLRPGQDYHLDHNNDIDVCQIP